MVLPTVEDDHRPAMAHPPVAGRRAHMVHQTETEDPAAVTVLQVVMTTLVAFHHRIMARHRVEMVVAGQVPLTAHLMVEVACLPAMVHQTGAVAMDLADHLRLTVHLATVVAVTQDPVDILEAEVVTLEAVETAATLEAAETEAILEEAVVDTLEAVAVATLEAVEVTTLEAEVVTLEEAETVDIQEVVARATPATVVTNTNRDKHSRMATFDLLPLLHHYHTKRRDANNLISRKSSVLLQRANIDQPKATSVSGRTKDEAKSKAVLANSTSFPKHP